MVDKSSKARLVYSDPVVHLPSNKTTTLPLEFDAASSSLQVTLPEVAFPLVIAFAVGGKIPEVKGGFRFGFPSFKFGSKGEVEESSSDSEDEAKEKKKPKVAAAADIAGSAKIPKEKKEKSVKFKVKIPSNIL